MVANVLIVNDTDKKLSPLAVTLKQQFYSICCVKTFEHAFKFVRKNNIDVILDDREKITLGAKIKDCKILGTPYLLVIGDKTDGTNFELENIKTNEKITLTEKELIEKFK